MDLQSLITLTTGITLLTCVLAVVGVHSYTMGKAQRQALVDRLSATGQIPVAGRHRRFRNLDRRLRRTKLGRKLELRLAATGLDITPGEFFVYMLATVVGLWLIGQVALAPSSARSRACWASGWRCSSSTGNARNASRSSSTSSLSWRGSWPTPPRLGLALRTAIGMAAEELEAPAGEELGKVAAQLAVGASMDDALGELTDRLPSRELVVLVTTLVLSNRAGGQVVSALRNLTETLEERKETRREVRTQLSQVNMTSYAVPVLGVGALLLLNAIEDGALDRMTGSPIGQACVIIAFGLYAIGFFLIRRLSRIDV